MKKRSLLIVSALLLTGLMGGAVKLSTSKGEVTIKGTSNVHDWESGSNAVEASGTVDFEGNKLKAINSMSITVPVKTIKSSKGSVMDSKTWDALKYKKYPNITFKLTKTNSITGSNGKYYVKAVGTVKIAGKTKTVNLNATSTVKSGKVNIKLSKKLKMTDFGVDPPTAFFGAMTTGDEITVVFDLNM